MKKAGLYAVIWLATTVALVGCARLDPFMFNNDNSITEYQLDDYTGEVDFILPVQYNLPENRVHLFPLEAEPGVTIWAIYLGDTATINTDTVIMYCHGNRDHMDFYWQRAKLLANTGAKNRYGVMMIDYRAFGLSEGEPTEKSLTHDVDIALQWLQKRGLTGNRLVMYGFSLGSAPATDLCADVLTLAPSKLILENPFASTEVMVNDAAVLAIPGSYVTSADYDNAEQIKKVQQPFLWMHGVEDDFLAMKTHGEVVFKNYGGTDAIAVRVPGAGHDGVPEGLGFEEYLQVVRDFLVR